MEPKSEGLEDDFPFKRGDFQVPAVSFQGCKSNNNQARLETCLGNLDLGIGDFGSKILEPGSHVFQTGPLTGPTCFANGCLMFDESLSWLPVSFMVYEFLQIMFDFYFSGSRRLKHLRDPLIVSHRFAKGPKIVHRRCPEMLVVDLGNIWFPTQI